MSAFRGSIRFANGLLHSRLIFPISVLSFGAFSETHCNQSNLPLPVYRKSDVANHKSAATGYWVTLKGRLEN